MNKKGDAKQMDIDAIPNNMEKYMACLLGKHLVFLDSFQFMSSSLGKLVANTPKCSQCENCQNDKDYTNPKFDDLKSTSKTFENKKNLKKVSIRMITRIVLKSSMIHNYQQKKPLKIKKN